MPARPLRWLLLLIGVGTVFWLGYSTGRAVSLADVLRLQRDADTARYTLTRGGVTLQYERLGGGGKPTLLLADGLPVVELSDWDRQARVVVDGSVFELVRLYPQSAVDYGRYRLAQTLNGPGWQLEREVTLEADGVVRIQHSFIARRPIRRVDLAVVFVRAAFLEVEVRDGGVAARFNRQPREQLEAGIRTPATHLLEVAGSPDVAGGETRFRVGDVAREGVLSFVAESAADAPPQDRRVALGGGMSLTVRAVAP